MPAGQFHFGEFALDLERYELTRSGEPIRLERIPMDLLILLVRERGRLVQRDEIIERLWGKGVFFDTDNSINTAIRKIRRALNEDPVEPRYIETVQGKGYRFKVPVGDSRQPSAFAAVERPPVMLAILPFENLSGDPAQEYFSDGLTEETIMRLGKIAPARLGVIARTSSMAYKRTTKSVRQIGDELGVDYVLEGSVRREPARIRVTAQLIRVADQTHLWAENFDCSPQSVLEIQDEVAAAIATTVQLKLTPAEPSQRALEVDNYQAFDLYLRGRFHHAKVTFAELQKAISCFQQALQLDPDYVLAQVALAESLVRLPITSDIPSRDAFPLAKAAVAKALHLDPDSAEAHASDGAIKFWFDWDFAGAETAARKAITLNPNYSMAYLYLAHVLSNTGRHDEALMAIRRALLLDPFSLIANTLYGQFLYHAAKLQESLRQLHSTLEMEPRFWVAHICLAKCCEQLGMHDEALAACEQAWQFSGGNSEALSIAVYIHAITGNRKRAEDKLKQLQDEGSKRYVPPYNLALIFAALNEVDTALGWLERAVEDRDVHMTFLLDHKWDALRSDRLFAALLNRCGFT